MSVEVMSGGGSANLQSKSIMPSSLPYTAAPDSGYDGFSGLTVRKPDSLISDNIVLGKKIFGVTGTTLGLKQLNSEMYGNDTTSMTFSLDSATSGELYGFAIGTSASSLHAINALKTATGIQLLLDNTGSTEERTSLFEAYASLDSASMLYGKGIFTLSYAVTSTNPSVTIQTPSNLVFDSHIKYFLRMYFILRQTE